MTASISVIAAQISAADWSAADDLDARAAEVAGVLALRETDGFLADTATANAFTADLESIYAVYPGLSAATAWRDYSDAIVVSLDPSADRDAVLGALPAELAFSGIDYLYHGWVVFNFDAAINAPAVAEWAEASIPGILAARPDSLLGDGDDVIYDSAEDLYAFKLASGDCPAGCIDAAWRYVLMSANGPVEVSAEDLEEIFSGALALEAKSSQQVARGDYLPKASVANGEFRVEHNGALVSGDTIEFASEADFGVYTITVERPYGLSPVEHSLEFTERVGGAVLTGERALNGWMHSEEFGWVNDQSFPWTYHETHGWIYVHPTAGDETYTWAFDREIGWMTLGRNTYPWTFSADRGWLYYLPGSDAPRLFFANEDASWIVLQ